MSFSFTESPRSRQSSANPPSLTLNYIAEGESNEQTVHAYAYGYTPAMYSTVYGTLYRQNITVSPQGSALFEVTVPYGPVNREIGQWDWDYDTTGGSVIITASKGTTAFPGGAPDHKGAIDVQGDEVRGTSVVIPALRINVTFKHGPGVITLPRVKNLARWTGKVNSTSFLTFDAGEVLFLGSRGKSGSSAQADSTYQFAMSENATGLSIGDIANVAKKGWEFLWVQFKPEVDGGKAVRQPEAAYAEQVYGTFDMAAALGFGG